MQAVDGPDLGFGDAIRAAEIELDGRGVVGAVLAGLEDGVDFLLRKLAVRSPGSSEGISAGNGKKFRGSFEL